MAVFTVCPGDHAFASGHAFEAPSSAEDALAQLKRRCAVVSPDDADTLVQVWRQFRENAEIGPNVKLGLGARLVNLGGKSQAKLLGDCVIRGVLRLEPNGKLEIGRFCYVGDGALLSAQAEIRVGEATLIAHGVQIFDNNSHPISAAQRERQFRRMMGVKEAAGLLEIDSAPILIGRRCWIGMNALVMKGVAIGDDAIVAAGSVVIDAVPPGVIVGGNPARVIRELTAAERALSAASV